MDIEIQQNNTFIYERSLNDVMKTSYFLDLLGQDPRMRVINFLLENNISDFTKKEIADQSGISRTTLDQFWDTFKKYNLIIKTRQIGNGTLYKLNMKSPIAKKLLDLDIQITKTGS